MKTIAFASDRARSAAYPLIAAALGARAITGEFHDHHGSLLYVGAVTEDGTHRVLGLWDRGVVTTFGEGSVWTAERVAALDPKVCDECGVHHARRRVFLAERVADGARVQLGGTCADRLSLDRLLRELKALVKALVALPGCHGEVIGEARGGSGGLTPWIGTGEAAAIAEYVAEYVAAGTYKSRKQAEDDGCPSTRDHALDLLRGWAHVNLLREKGAPAEAVERAAAWMKRLYAYATGEATSTLLDETLAWATSGTWSEYKSNVEAVLKGLVLHGYAEARRVSFLVAGVASMLQDRARAARDVAKAAGLRPYDGKEGAREALRGTWTVDFVKVIDGRFGATALATLVNGDGEAVTTFCSGAGRELLVKGARLAIKATLAGLDSYRPARVIKRAVFAAAA